MSGLLIAQARIVTPQGVRQPGWLATAGSAIAALGGGEPPAELAEGREWIDAEGGTLLPGFIDVHVHGSAGHETMDADPQGLDAMSAFLARHGVTAFLPTTWTAGTGELLAALSAVAKARDERLSGARVLGAHMEGPYLNPRRCGAQDRSQIRPADAREAGRFLDTAAVQVMTIAPEIGENLGLIAECARRGITASVGHSDATYGDVVRAVAAGARHVTHAFNAMRPLHHREPGAVGAALSVPQLACELIADNVHVHPAAVTVLVRAKGPDGMLLVTDALGVTGLPDRTYRMGERILSVRDGAVRLDGGALAGSILTMDAALRNLAAATGLPADVLWPATSRTAARSAGVADRKGALVDGMDADLVLLDADLQVRLTVVEGRIVHRGPETARPGERPGSGEEVCPTRAAREVLKTRCSK